MTESAGAAAAVIRMGDTPSPTGGSQLVSWLEVVRASRVGDHRVPESWQEALDAWEGWLKASGAPATTIEQRIYQLRRFAADHRGITPDAVTLDHLVLWLARHDHWRPNTLRTYRNGLRAFFAWMVAIERLPKSPAASLPRVRGTRGLPRPVDEEVLRDALSHADEREQMILLFAAFCGLRRAEIAQVRREDVRRDDRGRWLLRVHGKGDAYRDVPLNGMSSVVLSRPPGWLFPSPSRPGDHLTPAHVGVLASRLLPPGWALHTLRHRFATRVRAGGADIQVIAELLGHRNLENTRIYTLLPPDELWRAVEVAAVTRIGRAAAAPIPV